MVLLSVVIITMEAPPTQSYTINGVKVQFPCKAYPSQLSMMAKVIYVAMNFICNSLFHQSPVIIQIIAMNHSYHAPVKYWYIPPSNIVIYRVMYFLQNKYS